MIHKGFLMTGPSPEYLAAVEEGRRHHLGSKTYSGSFLRPHKPFLAEMIQRLGVESVLDVGAGKGVQYDWIDPEDGKTLEQAWGVPVTKYDPCWPPYAAEPEGQFDLVLCTHTISLIPKQDLDWWTERLFGFARKGVFIAEKIGERKKPEIGDPENRAIGWSAEQWFDYIGAAAFLTAAAGHPLEVALSTRETLKRGKITTRHIWREGLHVSSIEAEPRT
jgi:hypothetical protein